MSGNERTVTSIMEHLDGAVTQMLFINGFSHALTLGTVLAADVRCVLLSQVHPVKRRLNKI